MEATAAFAWLTFAGGVLWALYFLIPAGMAYETGDVIAHHVISRDAWHIANTDVLGLFRNLRWWPAICLLIWADDVLARLPIVRHLAWLCIFRARKEGPGLSESRRPALVKGYGGDECYRDSRASGLVRSQKVVLDLLTVKFLMSYLTKPIYVFGGWGFFSPSPGMFSLPSSRFS